MVAFLLGAAVWSAGRPFMAVGLFLLVAVVIPLVTWWFFERPGPGPDGEALRRQVADEERSLAHHEILLGPTHPDTLTARNNLAFDYTRVGRLCEAIAHYELALTLAIHTVGPRDPETLLLRRNLADAYRMAGRFADAIIQLDLAHCPVPHPHPADAGADVHRTPAPARARGGEGGSTARTQ
ncbi:hypothetical protein GCM10027294_35550 [Marinactinospora endophytica]